MTYDGRPKVWKIEMTIHLKDEIMFFLRQFWRQGVSRLRIPLYL